MTVDTVEFTGKRKRNWAPYILLLPSLVFLLFFFATPMANSFVLALQTPDGAWSLESIQTMVTDANFWSAIRSTLLLVVIVIPFQLALALAMALVINKRLKGTSLWLYVYALPLAISELAAGIVWVSIFTQKGWLNSILETLGLIERGVIWQSAESYWTLIGIIVVAEMWRATSIMMIILVAGLQSIPDEYLEAAEVYGATLWQRVRRVILPMLRPSLQVALILRIILAIQIFATAVALAGTGLTVMSQQTLEWANDIDNDNVAAAWAGLMLIMSIVATIGVLWLLPVKDEQQV
jgi:multiple sugar transport system permease protein